MKTRAGSLVVTGALLTAVLTGLPGTMTTPTSSAAPPPISFDAVGHKGLFSPNGDGVQDGVRVAYQLHHRTTRVTAVIRSKKDGRLVRRTTLGVQRPGRHVYAWNGRSSTNRFVPDGSYRLTLVAVTTGRKPVRGQLSILLDAMRRFPAGTSVQLTKSKVYPDTTGTTDAIGIKLGFAWPRRPEVRVVSSTGRTTR